MMENKRPIIIQGAMEMEVEELLKQIEVTRKDDINGFHFYIGNLDGYPVIISETQVGMMNATMATVLAIKTYNPIVIINQGVAGAHVDYIHRNDIVVGEKSVDINAIITGIKNAGEGSNPFEWIFNSRSVEVSGSDKLINMARNMENIDYNLFYGVLGSGDIFDREVDRIKWIHEKKNTLCEDNESIAVYTVCDRFGVDCIGFRIIGNNEVTQTKEDGATITRNLDKNSNKMIFKEHDGAPAVNIQNFVIKYAKELISSIKS